MLQIVKKQELNALQGKYKKPTKTNIKQSIRLNKVILVI
jgi:hypothetical protein